MSVKVFLTIQNNICFMSNFKEDINNVKAFIFDVDGVFTDSQLYLQTDGSLMRSMNAKDGYAVKYAIKQGYIVGIITGGVDESLRTRFRSLNVTDIYLGSYNKREDFDDFIYKYDISPENILYMGDDVPDLEIMGIVGIPTCPADAIEEIKSISKYISDKKGGEGCVRDVVEQVMRVHKKWN